MQVVKVIFKRLFRVYAHIYHSHFERIVTLGAEAHLNTCFKHFIFFVIEFELVESRELVPMQILIDSMTTASMYGGASMPVEWVAAADTGGPVSRRVSAPMCVPGCLFGSPD